MSFESVYNTSYGTIEVNKICNFIKSLSIKNQYDADLYETTESKSNYENNYYRPYLRLDNFYEYTATELKKINNRMKDYGKAIDDSYFNGTEADIQFRLQELYDVGNRTIVDFLENCRNYRIVFYEEKNKYYAQYDGYPLSDDQIIYVRNFDVPDPDAVVPIHIVTINNLPVTYRNIFVVDSEHDNEESGKGITAYMNLQPDYIYLRFIDKKPLFLTVNRPVNDRSRISYYLLRTCPNYTMLNWDSNILTDQEFFYFNKYYKQAVEKVNDEYLETFDERFPFYNKLLIINLLRYAVLGYSNSYLEKYSLHDYSLQNIYSILDSNNLSNLKNIDDKEKLFKLVKILDDLIIIKGSEEALIKIVTEVLGEDVESVRVCYLQRKYNVDNNGDYTIDLSKPIKRDIVIRETSIRNSSNLTDVYHDYDTFTADDMLWGGGYDQFGEINSYLKEELKNEIIKRNIDNIQTKHILFRKVINLIKIYSRQHDMFCMLVKYLTKKYGEGNTESVIHKNDIDIDGIQISPSVAFATLIYLYQLFNWYKRPYQLSRDEIVTPGKRGYVEPTQYSDMVRFYSSYFEDPETRDDEITNIFNIPFHVNSNNVVYLNTDNIQTTDKKRSRLFDTLYYYELTWDFYTRNSTVGDSVLSTLSKIYMGDDTIVGESGLTGVSEYITSTTPLAEQIINHLLTNYKYNTDDSFFNDSVQRYKEGVLPIGYAGVSTDLYKFDNNQLKLPVCRDSDTGSDVLTEFKERIYRSTTQEEYLMWNYIETHTHEDPKIVESFFNIRESDSVYEYDNLIDFIKSKNELFASYLYSLGLVGYSNREGFYGYDFNTLSDPDNVQKMMICDKLVPFEAKVAEAFRTWIQTFSIYTIMSPTDVLSDQSYTNDVKLLINEFVSIFKELKTVSYDVETETRYDNVLTMRSDLTEIDIEYDSREVFECDAIGTFDIEFTFPDSYNCSQCCNCNCDGLTSEVIWEGYEEYTYTYDMSYEITFSNNEVVETEEENTI